MKKVFSIVLIVSFCTILFAEEGYKFSIEPFFGVRSGTLYEYAFYVQPDNTEYKISQLEWQFTAAQLMGGTICSSFGPLEFSTTVLGLNHITDGILHDWDYENFDGEPTKFSEHRAELLSSLEASGSLAFRFEFDEAFSIAPFAAINYNYMSWDSYDGYQQYAPGNGYWYKDMPKDFVTGRCISYQNTMWYPSAGMNVKTSVFNFISLQDGLSATPYVFANSKDQHWKRNLEFLDTMRRGYGFFGDVKINVTFLRYHTLSFFANSQMIQSVKGKSEYRNLDEGGQGILAGRGGTANTNYSFGFSYKLTID